MPGARINVTRFEQGQGVTMTAATALTPGQAVKITAAKTVSVATAAADAVVGTVVKGGAINEKVTIRLRGDVIPMTASAAIAAGAKVTAAAAGKVATWGAGNELLGVAFTAATGADQEILVIVH